LENIVNTDCDIGNIHFFRRSSQDT